jgi:hypothetical protein
MLRLRCEFGGVKILGGGEKTGRAGWAQPPAEVVVGPALPGRVNHGHGHFFNTISQAGDQRSYAFKYPVPAKSSWQLESRRLKFSAELINTINEAAGNLRLPGQPESFLNIKFLLSII